MQSKIQIITDSASDFTIEQLAEYNVDLVPMPLLLGQDSYFDDKTISMKTLWTKMMSGETITTSQPSPSSFLEIFEAAKENGNAVICVLLSSALSGTYQSAVMAKAMAEYDEIYIIDSRCATSAEKLLVIEACRLRDSNEMNAAEIAERLEVFRTRIKLFACIDTLEYLVRGGRLSKMAGNIGSVLNIKPIFTFAEDGSIKIVKKVSGSQKVMNEMCRQITAIPVDTNYPIIPLFACDDSNCRRLLGSLSDAEIFLVNITPEEIGATIGTYIGPGGFGITFVSKDL